MSCYLFIYIYSLHNFIRSHGVKYYLYRTTPDINLSEFQTCTYNCLSNNSSWISNRLLYIFLQHSSSPIFPRAANGIVIYLFGFWLYQNFIIIHDSFFVTSSNPSASLGGPLFKIQWVSNISIFANGMCWYQCFGILQWPFNMAFCFYFCWLIIK